MAEDLSATLEHAPKTASLLEVHRSINVPVETKFWRKLWAFSGPGFLGAVGYTGPANWAAHAACDLAEVIGSVIALNVLFDGSSTWPGP